MPNPPLGAGEVSSISASLICPRIWDSYKQKLNESGNDPAKIEMVERFAFYERARHAYAIIATGESAIYANVLLKKGVVQ